MLRSLALATMIFILAFASGSAAAHGGGTPRLVDASAGSYRLYLWSKPEPIRVGNVHFTIGVFEPPAGDASDVPVLDAKVDVSLKPLDNQAPEWSGSASRELSSNKLYYELDFELPAVGNWRAMIEVEGPAGAGQAQFDFEALPPSPVNWMVLGGGAAVLLASAWWWWNSRVQKSDLE